MPQRVSNSGTRTCTFNEVKSLWEPAGRLELKALTSKRKRRCHYKPRPIGSPRAPPLTGLIASDLLRRSNIQCEECRLLRSAGPTPTGSRFKEAAWIQ
jgi:hypothetical protein